jgi:hypothetical protein
LALYTFLVATLESVEKLGVRLPCHRRVASPKSPNRTVRMSAAEELGDGSGPAAKREEGELRWHASWASSFTACGIDGTSVRWIGKTAARA